MSTETLVPEIGQIVAVRQRLYLVDHVIPPPNPSDSLLLRLSCVDDDAQGQPLDVLWDRELDAQVITGRSMGRHRKTRVRSCRSFRCLPEHAALELRHVNRS
jgi:hypothetical protein